MPTKSKKKSDLNEHSETYSKLRGKYDALGGNLAQALKQFLRENKIKVLSVDFRVKEKGSFIEKIERKNYENPFEEIEDICGIRVICYYQSEVDQISEIIKREFEIVENQDKEELLEIDQFGYRSTHFIVKIKENWLAAPNYRGLENLKAEIQIRTVLMHAWAEIEHKLAYKNETHIHPKLRRTFSRISAKLEEADEQFEELKTQISNYKEDVTEIFRNKSKEINNVGLNVDSLHAFLATTFPDRIMLPNDVAELVSEFSSFGISLQDFIYSYERVKDYLPEIEEEYFGVISSPKEGWEIIGIARMIMLLTNLDFLNGIYESDGDTKKVDPYEEIDRKWWKIINESEQ